MPSTFTIIDSFRTTEALRERGVDVPTGTWFVLDGSYDSAAELPQPGAVVVIAAPDGETLCAVIAHAEVRHRRGAVSFAPNFDRLPRLSTVSVA